MSENVQSKWARISRSDHTEFVNMDGDRVTQCKAFIPLTEFKYPGNPRIVEAGSYFAECESIFEFVSNVFWSYVKY
jgi:hypothetical protein